MNKCKPKCSHPFVIKKSKTHTYLWCSEKAQGIVVQRRHGKHFLFHPTKSLLVFPLCTTITIMSEKYIYIHVNMCTYLYEIFRKSCGIACPDRTTP